MRKRRRQIAKKRSNSNGNYFRQCSRDLQGRVTITALTKPNFFGQSANARSRSFGFASSHPADTTRNERCICSWRQRLQQYCPNTSTLLETRYCPTTSLISSLQRQCRSSRHPFRDIKEVWIFRQDGLGWSKCVGRGRIPGTPHPPVRPEYAQHVWI